jgi:hypothetical protein
MIETKEVSLFGSREGDKYMRDQYNKCHSYIQDLTAFGWQPTQTTSRRSGRSSHTVQIMARETSMAHYNEYRRLENDYETAKGEIKYYSPMEASTVFLLLLILIIPGALYIAYKSNQKSNIESHNQQCNAKMQKAVASARNIK